MARRLWSLPTSARTVPPVRVVPAAIALLWPEWAEGQTQLVQRDTESIAPQVCVYVLK